MDICKYAIGQILTAKRDLKVEKAMSGEIVEVKKDSKVIIGAGAMEEATVCGLAMILFTIFGIAFRKRR